MRNISPESLRKNAVRLRKYQPPLYVTAENLDMAAATIARLEGRLSMAIDHATKFRNRAYARYKAFKKFEVWRKS